MCLKVICLIVRLRIVCVNGVEVVLMSVVSVGVSIWLVVLMSFVWWLLCIVLGGSDLLCCVLLCVMNSDGIWLDVRCWYYI